MKFYILSDILFELLLKGKLTAKYLAEKHDLSVRTVYRYVDTLSMSVPVYVKRGRNGGIYIADNYKLPMGFMTEDEYDAIIDALEIAYSQTPEERFLIAKEKISSQKKLEKQEDTIGKA